MLSLDLLLVMLEDSEMIQPVLKPLRVTKFIYEGTYLLILFVQGFESVDETIV